MVYYANEKYLEKFRLDRQDFTNNVPSRRIETFPKSGNEGLYGWTFRPSDGRIRRREDLIGTFKGLETDIHENIHTSDERETRYLTAWIMEHLTKENNKYHKEVSYRR